MDRKLLKKTGEYMMRRGEFSVPDMQHDLGLSFGEVYEVTMYFREERMIRHVGGRRYSCGFGAASLERHLSSTFDVEPVGDCDDEYEKDMNEFLDRFMSEWDERMGEEDPRPAGDGKNDEHDDEFDPVLGERVYDEEELRMMFGPDFSVEDIPEEFVDAPLPDGDSAPQSYEAARRNLEGVLECLDTYMRRTASGGELVEFESVRNEFARVRDEDGFVRFMERRYDYISGLIARQKRDGED